MTRLFLAIVLFCCSSATAQSLQPGFDKAEYIELLKASIRQGDSYHGKVAPPQHASFVYRSPIVGLDNRWDLWMSDKKTAIISIRGTTANSVSWLANFYAAMVPATGKLTLAGNEYFDYQLATNPRAAVHIGWLVATAYLVADMQPRIDSLLQKGIRDILIIGHSQGGAIAYLLNAYLYYQRAAGKLPADLRIKTYCSAAPKPGNLYFAYDYEAMTQHNNGWSFNVVNSADWVPETPVSIQTLNDFNNVNPFIDARKMARKQAFPKNLFMRYAINRMDKPTKRAQRNYQRFLGNMAAKMVTKQLPGFKAPEYVRSNDYVRCGHFIVLQADSAYYELYPDNKEKIFVHHFPEAYLYLAERQL